MGIKDTPASRELDYCLSKWILKNLEQLLEPDEIEAIWQELLSYAGEKGIRTSSGYAVWVMIQRKISVPGF